MRLHKPVSQLRWQNSQKRVLNNWRYKHLDQECTKQQERILPILERYARHYPEEATLLEIGCGPICISRHLTQKNKTFIDPLIDDYRRMFPGQLPEDELLATSAEHINKPDHSYDLIVCIDALSNSLHPELIMNEIERLLKTDGKLIISVRVHSQVEARLHYWAERFLPFLTRTSRPYYYALSGIRRTLARHFKIRHEITRNAQILWLPFFKREKRIYICSPLKIEPAEEAPSS